MSNKCVAFKPNVNVGVDQEQPLGDLLKTTNLLAPRSYVHATPVVLFCWLPWLF